MSPGPATAVVERADGQYMVLRPALLQRLAVVGLLAVIPAISLLPDDSGERLPLGISLPFCGLMMIVAWRQGRMRVELGPTARIVNFLSTRAVPWNELQEFGYDGQRAWVVLMDGRRHGISAFSPGFRSLPVIERGCREAVRLMEGRRKSRLNNRRGRH